MNIPYSFRQCNKCNKFKILSDDNFYKQVHGKFGYSRTCEKCANKYKREQRRKQKLNCKTDKRKDKNRYLTDEQRKILIKSIVSTFI